MNCDGEEWAGWAPYPPGGLGRAFSAGAGRVLGGLGGMSSLGKIAFIRWSYSPVATLCWLEGLSFPALQRLFWNHHCLLHATPSFTFTRTLEAYHPISQAGGHLAGIRADVQQTAMTMLLQITWRAC